MRKNLLFIVLLFCLGAASPDSALQVDIELEGASIVKLGEQVRFKATLRNASTTPMVAVTPGDGSESGWREPHVHYSAEKWNGQSWTEVPVRGIFRCGLYDPHWQKDVVTLSPGATLDIGAWLPGADSYFDLSPGRYRFRLHYQYGAGGNAKGKPGPSSIPEALRGVKSYHLVSAPVEYTVSP